MLATIWMCTQEWSLIWSLAIALTFETCQSAFSSVSCVHAVEDRPQLAVAAGGHADPHLRDRLRRRHAGLPLELGRRRRFVDDQLFGLLLIGHTHSVRA